MTEVPPEKSAHTEEQSNKARSEADALLKKNTLISTLGAVGKASAPLYLVLTTRLYGMASFGIFATAQVFAEMTMSILTAGFNDAALMAAAKQSALTPDDIEEKKRLDRDLGTAVFWILTLSTLLMLPAVLISGAILPKLYSFGEELAVLLRWMAIGVPLFGLTRVFVAVTMGHQNMKYDAIVNGIVRPGSLLVFATLYYFLIGGPVALALAWTTAQFTAFLFSLKGFIHYARPGDLIAAVKERGLSKNVVRFALPQSLSVTFQRYAGGIGVVMLGMFGASAVATGAYSLAVQIIENAINTVRFVFSNALNPFIPKLLAAGNREELQQLLQTTQRRSALACSALAAAMLLIEPEVMTLFSTEWVPSPSMYSALLGSYLLMACFGLAGSVVVLGGHSRHNLMNAVIAGVVNVALCTILIMPFGSTGAASATAISTALLCALQIYQAERLEKIIWPWRFLRNSLFVALIAILGATLLRERLDLGFISRVGILFAVLGFHAYFWLRERPESTEQVTR